MSPADAEIAAHIQRIADAGDVGALPRSLGYEIAAESVVDAYIEATAAVAPAPAGAGGFTWVYTAMHGVGWETLSRIVDVAGYPEPVPVDAQLDPDGAFPTVAFPNPEEPGAMDLAFETARNVNADLVIANDPDADRLAVAVPDPHASGGWRRLTGNQIGLLLGWRAARLAREADAPAGASLACSLVSSPGLKAVADHYGLDFHTTLTGFKWISRAPGIVFGFEEALGYLVNPETVRDKDGISAAIAMLGMVTEARGRGESLARVLAEFDATFGFFASDQISIRVEDVSTIGRIMAALRERHPSSIGGVAVEQRRRPARGRGRPALRRRPAAVAGRRFAGHHPAERNGAQAEALPRRARRLRRRRQGAHRALGDGARACPGRGRLMRSGRLTAYGRRRRRHGRKPLSRHPRTPSPAPADPPDPPHWLRKVILFLSGQTISLLGSMLVQYAVFWYLTITYQSGVIMMLAALFGFLPQAVVSIFGGVWADRHNRKYLIIAGGRGDRASRRSPWRSS